jgi:exo-beta-1,3-glucanase (GH17 family)
MQRNYFLVFSLSIIIAVSSCTVLNSETAFAAPVIVEPVYNSANGHYYGAIPGNINWFSANAEAQSMSFKGVNGHLVTISSQDENDFILNNLGGPVALNGYWLGGIQPPGSAEPGGGWKWVTDEPWYYTNWYYVEPNNAYGGDQGVHPVGWPEDALVFWWSVGQWNDFPSDIPCSGFIVEYDVESGIPTLVNTKAWYVTNNTCITSTVMGDVDGDGQIEIVSGGYCNDGLRDVAQLCVWNGATLELEQVKTWYWTGSTVINSVRVADVDGDSQIEIVTGGSYFDGTRYNAQLVVWNGSSLAVEKLTGWFWTGNTMINSVAAGDVDGDGHLEIVTGGSYFDGVHKNAQLIVWDGSTLSLKRVTCWKWTGDTVVNSVGIGDVNGDGQTEIFTGGSYFDGTRNNAQLVVWNGANLAAVKITGWYWTSNTVINSVALGDVNGDGHVEIVSGGYYNDGTRNNAQLIVWNGTNLTVERITGWYWSNNTVINSVAIGDVDGDGQAEIVTAGQYNDGSRDTAQLALWSGSNLAAIQIKSWYWTSNTEINSVTIGDVNNDFSNEIVTGGSFYDGIRLNSQLTVWKVIYTPIYKLFGLDFSPYIKNGQDPNLGTFVSEDQIRALMTAIKPYTGWVRTFGCTNGLEVAGRVAHELGLKIAVGAWLGTNSAANEIEISNLINIGKAGNADMMIVGSEVLLRGDLTEAQLIGFINRTRNENPGIPVATADVYTELLAHPAVLEAGDVVLPNYYPYWEGVNLSYAVSFIHVRNQEIIAAAGNKPVIISETGWPSAGNKIGDAIPSPENAAYFFLNFQSWAKAESVSSFYFEALDEPWKANYEGPQGAHWGVWDNNIVLKPGMRAVFDGETIPDNWSGNEIIDGPGNATINFTFVPPYGSFDNLRGQVSHVKPADCRVVVYIKVASNWWIKPYYASPLTIIQPTGSWVCDITTGGVDQTATEIAAYLIPVGYNPPTQPSVDLEQHAIANCSVSRSP